MHFYRKCWFGPFWGAIHIPFFVRLPVTNAWNCHSLYTAFSSNVGAWGIWACSLFLSYSICSNAFIPSTSRMRNLNESCKVTSILGNDLFKSPWLSANNKIIIFSVYRFHKLPGISSYLAHIYCSSERLSPEVDPRFMNSNPMIYMVPISFYVLAH